MLITSRTVLKAAGAALFVVALAVAPTASHANLGQCSQPFTNGTDPSASDCLKILRTAVGNDTCSPACACAPKGTLPVRTTDALICLQRSVDGVTALNCPCTDLRAPAYAFAPGNVVNTNIQSCFAATDYIGPFPQGVSPATGDWSDDWTVWLHGNDSIWEPATGGTLAGGVPSANAACPAGTTDIGNTTLPPPFAGSMDICQLAARYTTGTITLTNDNVYRLGGAANQGTIFGNGDAAGRTVATASTANLVIEPGTLVIGSETEALTISRGSNIDVNGTEVDPVVMLSLTNFNSWKTGQPVTGDAEWGGLVITGFGYTNQCNNEVSCDALAEGFINPLNYGGPNAPASAADDSGDVEYLVIQNGGFDLDGNGSELNGLTMYGLGFNTNIHHVQVHDNFDDGFEWFGGEACAHHLVATSIGDDSVDTDLAFEGGAQFIVVKQEGDLADRGYEMDNNTATPSDTPVSTPTFANACVLGTPTSGGGLTPTGIMMRSGTGAYHWNGIVDNDNICVRMDNGTLPLRGGVLANANDGVLQIHNYTVDCPTTNFRGSGVAGETNADVQTWFQADADNRIIDPTVSSTCYPGDITNN